MAKKKRMSNFKKFLIIYCTLLVITGAVVIGLLYSLLKDYEEGISSNKMDEIINEFTSDNIEKLLADNNVSVNEFESTKIIADYMKSKINNNTVTYKKKAGEFSEKTPVYVVYAGDTAIAKVTLAEDGKNAHNFTRWKLGEISFGDYTKSMGELTITVPSKSQLTINGVLVSDSYIAQRDVTFDPVKNVGSYTATPTNVVYKIGKLIAAPEVKVTLNGTQLEVKADKLNYTAFYPTDNALLEAQKDRIKKISEDYGKYLINRGSLTTLQGYMTGRAAEYISDIPAIWAFLYGKTFTYEFKNESITNFRKYNDTCFSCDVYYDLFVDYKTGNTTYETSMTYTFVLQNNEWVVADFMIN